MFALPFFIDTIKEMETNDVTLKQAANNKVPKHPILNWFFPKLSWVSCLFYALMIHMSELGGLTNKGETTLDPQYRSTCNEKQ